MKLRGASLGPTALHYVLAYAIALPIFLFFVIARRLRRRTALRRRSTP